MIYDQHNNNIIQKWNIKNNKFVTQYIKSTTKFTTKHWVEVNDESSGNGTYNRNSQIKFEITILKSSLCDYSLFEGYILVKGTITVNNIFNITQHFYCNIFNTEMVILENQIIFMALWCSGYHYCTTSFIKA